MPFSRLSHGPHLGHGVYGVAAAELLFSMVSGREELDPALCWPTPGESRNDAGYATLRYKGRMPRAHRLALAWELGFGDDLGLPDYLDGQPVSVDHSVVRGCRYRDCANPNHLNIEFVAQNTLLGNGPTAQNARKETCLRGHALVGDNLIPDPRWGRGSCRRCKRTRNGARNYLTRHRKDITPETRSRVVSEVLHRLALLATPSGKSWGTDAYALAPHVLAEIETATPAA